MFYLFGDRFPVQNVMYLSFVWFSFYDVNHILSIILSYLHNFVLLAFLRAAVIRPYVTVGSIPILYIRRIVCHSIFDSFTN